MAAKLDLAVQGILCREDIARILLLSKQGFFFSE